MDGEHLDIDVQVDIRSKNYHKDYEKKSNLYWSAGRMTKNLQDNEKKKFYILILSIIFIALFQSLFMFMFIIS